MVSKKFSALVCAILVLPATAHAYVDPGTGAYLLQLLIAVFGAIIFYISRPLELFRLIRSYFTKKSKENKE
ncbi:hypothetical protein [Massilia sp. PWRC2]|uniref:hypothetical protein n=1 Tax=Massilia sp. PWRC2 TaxID=2804626 RepID=UPI003CF68CBF